MGPSVKEMSSAWVDQESSSAEPQSTTMIAWAENEPARQRVAFELRCSPLLQYLSQLGLPHEEVSDGPCLVFGDSQTEYQPSDWGHIHDTADTQMFFYFHFGLPIIG